MRIFLTIITSCFLLTTHSLETKAQTVKKPQTTPNTAESKTKTETPLTTQKATTEEGKLVLLKSDGTWDYSNDINPNNSTVSSVISDKNGVLRFKVAVITRSGIVKPVPRGEFRLLDEDIKVILASQATQVLKTGDRIDKTIPYMKANTANNFELIKPHIIAKTTTDFEGNGEFSDLAPKTYYLYFFDKVADNIILWSFKVDVKSGNNSILIDQNDAIEIL